MQEHKTIFLSGGTGFFGKSILSARKRGLLPNCALTILSRNPEKFQQEYPQFRAMPGVKFVRGDVRNFDFSKERFDAVIHGAAPTKKMPPGIERDIILKGTQRMLNFASHCETEHFLFISSGAVYGPQANKQEKIPEDSSCHPVTEYGIAKLEAEQMCLASSLDCKIARCFAFAGPYLNRDIHFAIGNFIRDCLGNQEITITGDGTPMRSYLYADDLAQWLFELLFRGLSGEIYNVGSDEALSIRALAEKVRMVLGKHNRIRILQNPVSNKKAEWYVPSISKVQRELGLAVKVRLDETIRKSAEQAI